MSEKLTIGLFGFGVVGEGIYKVLNSKPGFRGTVKKVCIKHPEKQRNAPAELFTIRAEDILEDPEIDVVVELIDDAEAAYQIVCKAIRARKAVVSANKKMIAENHFALLNLLETYPVPFLYEAAVCGSIPIIRNLEEYFDNDLLNSVTGVVNGSTNYILTQMSGQDQALEEVLKDAQDLGFAEQDPTLDIEGFDAAYKLSILTLHAFGRFIDPDQILRKGISGLHPFDFAYAREKGKHIKLIASVQEFGEDQCYASVFPTLIDQKHQLSSISNEYNGLLIGSGLSDEQLMVGKGAGRYPTSSAVLSDISALRYDYRYEYKKVNGHAHAGLTYGRELRTFYLGFSEFKPEYGELFEEIEESFSGKKRSYLIGKVSPETLVNEIRLWSGPEVSLIEV